jgi:hypothetical protein
VPFKRNFAIIAAMFADMPISDEKMRVICD